MNKQYGVKLDGTVIVAPSGWEIMPEGTWIAGVHREFLEHPMGYCNWCPERRGPSTMTPLTACVSGWIRAFAVPTKENHDYPIES